MAGHLRFSTKQLLGHAFFLSFAFSVGNAGAAESCASLPDAASGVRPVATAMQDAPDYVAINRVLQLTDDVERRARLQAEIAGMTSSKQPEAMALVPRLRIALAYSEIRLGNPAAAMAELRQVPLESSQAATALVLLGEVTRQAESAAKAGTWILHAAELYPRQPETIEGLLLAAQWQKSDQQALPFLLRATSLADTQFAAVSALLEQMNSAGFIDSLAVKNPDPLLWSLASEALTDPAFTAAHEIHQQSRTFRDCLQDHMGRLAALQEKNPALIRDLGQTLQQLDVLLPAARAELPGIESAFLESARALKHCREQGSDCRLQQAVRDGQGQELTRMRNRLRIMERQHRFLMAEQQRLLDRSQAEQKDMAALGMTLLKRNVESRQIMAAVLQQTLEKSQTRWQDLSARAHFELASAQERLLRQSPQEQAQNSRM